jgi:hypothetical protein
LKSQGSTAGRIIHANDTKGATGTQACFAKPENTMKGQASTAGRIIHAIDAKGASGTQACFASPDDTIVASQHSWLHHPGE